MTTTAITPEISYSGDGTSTAFPIPFRFLEGTITATLFSAAGVGTLQSPSSHFSLTGGPSGGTLTMVTAPAAGTRLRIRRATGRTQNADYETNDTFPAETHEGALDRLSLITQEMDVRVNDVAARALIAADGQTGKTFDATGLGDGDLLEFRGNKVQRFPAAPFAGKFYGGQAVSGQPLEVRHGQHIGHQTQFTGRLGVQHLAAEA